MSQKIIYNILKNDLGGSGTRQNIIDILIKKYPEVSPKTVTDKLTRLRRWSCVGYKTPTKTWFITGEFDHSSSSSLGESKL